MRSFVPSSSWEFYIFTQLDRARWLSNGYGEADSRLFKLLRYLNVATIIHKWRVGALAHQRYLDKCYKKEKTEPVAVPLDFEPERCTLTMKPEISTRASLLPILRLGPLLLSDTCFNPQQAGRERNVGP